MPWEQTLKKVFISKTNFLFKQQVASCKYWSPIPSDYNEIQASWW